MRMRLLFVTLLLLVGALSTNAQDDGYAEALRRIEAARDSGATALGLNWLGFTEVPPEIGQLTNLQVLNLFGNQLTTLPPEIGQLENLQVLSLDQNRLTTLPPEIGQLSNLQGLYLGDNQLTTLPPEIGLLSNLQWLDLGDNQLTILPSEIGQLNRLCFLNLASNNLRQLPTSMGSLNSLSKQEYCLETPVSGLNLIGNPLISPPPEVVEQGTAAVLDYLRNQAWYYLQRLIVGAASGVGLLAAIVLGLRFRQQRRKPKRKRG